MSRPRLPDFNAPATDPPPPRSKFKDLGDDAKKSLGKDTAPTETKKKANGEEKHRKNAVAASGKDDSNSRRGRSSSPQVSTLPLSDSGKEKEGGSTSSSRRLGKGDGSVSSRRKVRKSSSLLTQQIEAGRASETHERKRQPHRKTSHRKSHRSAGNRRRTRHRSASSAGDHQNSSSATGSMRRAHSAKSSRRAHREPQPDDSNYFPVSNSVQLQRERAKIDSDQGASDDRSASKTSSMPNVQVFGELEDGESGSSVAESVFDGGWSASFSDISAGESSSGDEQEAAVILEDVTEELLPPLDEYEDLTGSSPSPKGPSKSSALARSFVPPPLLRRSSRSLAEVAVGLHVAIDKDTGTIFVQSATQRQLVGLVSGRLITLYDSARKKSTTDKPSKEKTVLTEPLLEFVDMVLYTLPYFTTPEQMVNSLYVEFCKILPAEPNARLSKRQATEACRVLVFFERMASVHFELILGSELSMKAFLQTVIALRDVRAVALRASGLESMAAVVESSVANVLGSVHRHLARVVRDDHLRAAAKKQAEKSNDSALARLNQEKKLNKKDKKEDKKEKKDDKKEKKEGKKGKKSKQLNTPPVQAESESEAHCGGHHEEQVDEFSTVLRAVDVDPVLLRSPLLLEALIRHPSTNLIHDRRRGLVGVIRQAFVGSDAVNWMISALPHAVELHQTESGHATPRAACVSLLEKHLLLGSAQSKFADSPTALFVFQTTQLEAESAAEGTKTPLKDVKKSKSTDDLTLLTEENEGALCDLCSRTLFGETWKPQFSSLMDHLRPKARGVLPLFTPNFRLHSDDRVDPLAKVKPPLPLPGDVELEHDEFICKNCGRISGLAPPPWTAKGLNGELNLLDISPREFARQITIVDANLFAAVPMSDFRRQNWNSEDVVSVAEVDFSSKRYLSPFRHDGDCRPGEALRHLIAHINRVSYWVATEVVLAPKARSRARVVEYFIMVAKFCYELNNYSSLFAVVNGLQHPSVSRFSAVWDTMDRRALKVFRSLQVFTLSTKNFQRYRRELRLALQESSKRGGLVSERLYGGSDAAEPLFGSPALGAPYDTSCVIPYIAVDLRDLTFIEDGNDDLITHSDGDAHASTGEESDKCINLEKMRLLATVFSNLQRCQVECRDTVPINIAPSPEIQAYITEHLHAGQVLTSAQLYEYSKLADPTGDSPATFQSTLSRKVSSVFSRSSRQLQVPAGLANVSATPS